MFDYESNTGFLARGENLSMTMCAESSPANYVIDTTTRGAHTLKFVEYL